MPSHDAAGSPLPRTAPPEEVMREALAALERGGAVALATVISRQGSAPASPGQKLAVVDLPGAPASAVGTVGGGAVELAAIASMREAIAAPDAAPKVHTFRLGPSLGMCCGGSCDILIEVLRPGIDVVIVGAGHVGLATARLLPSLGFRVVLADSRDDAVAAARVSEVESLGVLVVHSDHDDPEILAAVRGPRDRGAVLVMTHDHQLDQRVIEWALAKGFGYVGGVGSRAKAERTRARLVAHGSPATDVARVRMPIGLDIGARRPAEIAVSIAAELVALRADREGTRRRPHRTEPSVDRATPSAVPSAVSLATEPAVQPTSEPS